MFRLSPIDVWHHHADAVQCRAYVQLLRQRCEASGLPSHFSTTFIRNMHNHSMYDNTLHVHCKVQRCEARSLQSCSSQQNTHRCDILHNMHSIVRCSEASGLQSHTSKAFPSQCTINCTYHNMFHMSKVQP